MITLEGFSNYFVKSFNISEKLNGDFDTMKVELSPQYYYNIKYETGKVKLIRDGKNLFTGVVCNIDYDYDGQNLYITLKEYIYVLKYKYDLYKVSSSYDISLTSYSANTLATDILSGTIFSLNYIYDTTIDAIQGNKLNLPEWLQLTAQTMYCGLDALGDYTTNPTNIVSNKRTQDIIVDYDNDSVTFGVKGCYRKDVSSNPDIFTQKVLNIDDYILKIDELQDKVYKTQRVIVIGNTESISGSAYITSDTDVPVEVIRDSSCADEEACKKRAEEELNLRYSIESLNIEVEPNLYFDNNIEVGMKIIITNPALFNNEYLLTEIDVTEDSLVLTLGSPKQRLLTSLNELNERVRKLERW
jgi:hypothetical protein